MSLTRIRIYYVSIIVFQFLLSILFLRPTFFRWAVRVRKSVGSHANIRLRNDFAISVRGEMVSLFVHIDQSSLFY